MGGSVGLKGTDGTETLREAVARGAKPVSPDRARRFLEIVGRRRNLNIVAPEGPMGGDLAKEIGIEFLPVNHMPTVTSREDTIRASREMLKMGIHLLAFVGGDGTARDILEAVGERVPTIGVPAGVKVYSSVFAISPSAAGYTTLQFLSDELSTAKGEVMDVNEDEYRNGRLAVSLMGYLVTVGGGQLLQNPKSPSMETESDEMDSIADYVAEEIVVPDHVYILGPGTTVEKLAHKMGLEKKTMLGVDVVKGDGTMLELDASEKQILPFAQSGKARIVVSPIGGQGFLLGRGNQQISPRIIWEVGIENVIVLATKTKLGSLRPRRLLVDTGDPDLDQRMRGYRRAIIGYREEMIVKVE